MKLIKMKLQKYLKILNYNGGEGGIRTHERVAPLLVFKTSAFNRSATSPKNENQTFLILSIGSNNNKDQQIFKY